MTQIVAAVLLGMFVVLWRQSVRILELLQWQFRSS